MNKITKMIRLRLQKRSKRLNLCNLLFPKGYRLKIHLKNFQKPFKELQQKTCKRKGKYLMETSPSLRRRKIQVCVSQCTNHGPLFQCMGLRDLKGGNGPINLEVHSGFTQQLRNLTRSSLSNLKKSTRSSIPLQGRICQNFRTDTSTHAFQVELTWWTLLHWRSMRILSLRN